MSILDLTAVELGKKIKAGEITAVQDAVSSFSGADQGSGRAGSLLM